MQEGVCPGSLDTPGHSGRVCGGFRGVRQGPARIWEGAIRGYVGRQGYLGYLEGNRGCRGHRGPDRVLSGPLGESGSFSMLAGKSLGSGILAAVGGGGSRTPPEMPTGCSEGSGNTGVKQLSPEISWGQAGSTGKRGTVGDLRNCGRVVPGLRDLDGHSRSSVIGGRGGSLRLKVGVDLPFPFARRWPSSARGPQRPGAAGAAGRAPPGGPSCGGRGGAGTQGGRHFAPAPQGGCVTGAGRPEGVVGAEPGSGGAGLGLLVTALGGASE